MCNSNYSFYFPFVLISVDNNITRCHQDCHWYGLCFSYYHSCSLSIIVYCKGETLAVVLFLETQP